MENFKEKFGKKKHLKIIVIQLIFLAVVFAVLYVMYPKTSLEIDGNLIRFSSINADVIILSENPDFSNPHYLDAKNNLSFSLNPGTYYWKASNNYIEGSKREFTIDSEVGMKIEKEEADEMKLVNIGNAKLNVTKDKEGVMVGHIILEPNESEEIESGNYTGRQK